MGPMWCISGHLVLLNLNSPYCSKLLPFRFSFHHKLELVVGVTVPFTGVIPNNQPSVLGLLYWQSETQCTHAGSWTLYHYCIADNTIHLSCHVVVFSLSLSLFLLCLYWGQLCTWHQLWELIISLSMFVFQIKCYKSKQNRKIRGCWIQPQA